MTRPEPRKRLFDGAGLLQVDDFCRASGVTRTSVKVLLAAGLLEVAYNEAGQVVGLWDDVLPTPERLQQIGFTVRSGYEPDLLRSTTDHDLEDDTAADHSTSTWTMSW